MAHLASPAPLIINSEDDDNEDIYPLPSSQNANSTSTSAKSKTRSLTRVLTRTLSRFSNKTHQRQNQQSSVNSSLDDLDLQLLPLAVTPMALDCLNCVNHLTIHQLYEPQEDGSGAGDRHTVSYNVYSSGQTVLFYGQDSKRRRHLTDWNQSIHLMLKDRNEDTVIEFRKTLSTTCGPSAFQGLAMQVFSPPGSLIGTVEREWRVVQPRFVAKDACGRPMLKIRGPWTPFCVLWRDAEFGVYTPNGREQLGNIVQEWRGSPDKLWSCLHVEFPLELNLTAKAVLLGASVLIGTMFNDE